MKLLLFGISLLGVLIEGGGAIQCYECANTPLVPGPANCGDPFDMEGIPTVQCDGKCYANSSVTTNQGHQYTALSRGCITNVADECGEAAMCQDINSQDGTATGRRCSYCCDQMEMCNSFGLEAAAEAATQPETFNCWACEAEIAEGMDPEPKSCGSDDYNGDTGITVPCETKCVKMMSREEGTASTTVTRTCDVNNLCAQSENDDTIHCCDGELCNTGAIDDDDDGIDDDDKIECLSCKSNEADTKSACFKGMFPADNVTKVECPTRRCITYTEDISDSESIFSRACVSAEDMTIYCDDIIPSIRDVECCSENLCNGASNTRAIGGVSSIFAGFILFVILGFI